jgi:hypothetical protein
MRKEYDFLNADFRSTYKLGSDSDVQKYHCNIKFSSGLKIPMTKNFYTQFMFITIQAITILLML